MIGMTNYACGNVETYFKGWYLESSKSINDIEYLPEKGYYLAAMMKGSSSNSITSTGTATSVYDGGTGGLLIKKIQCTTPLQTVTFTGTGSSSDYYTCSGLVRITNDINFPSSVIYNSGIVSGAKEGVTTTLTTLSEGTYVIINGCISKDAYFYVFYESENNITQGSFIYDYTYPNICFATVKLSGSTTLKSYAYTSGSQTKTQVIIWKIE